MRVLLVQGYLGRDAREPIVFPLGLAYVAAALQADGHDVRLLDPNLESAPFECLRDALQEFRPEIVGLSLRSIDNVDRLDYRDHYQHLAPTILAVRNVLPTVAIMIGGAGFSMFAREIMLRHTELTFGVYLEGEETAVELLRHLADPGRVAGLFYREGDAIVFTGPRPWKPLTDLPRPAYDVAQLARYLDAPLAIGVQTQRGCPLDCAYCNYPLLNGHLSRTRAAAEVVDEIEHLVQARGVREIVFTDSLLDVVPGHAEDICRELLARGVRVRWSAWFAVKGFSESFLELAWRSGCYRMCFSPDAATDRTLAALHKPWQEADLESIVRLAGRHQQIDFRFTVFCAPPEQDLRDVWMCVRLFLRTHLLLRNSRCLLSWVRILPGTEVHRRALGEGAVGAGDALLPSAERRADTLFYSPGRLATVASPFFVRLHRVVQALRRGTKRWAPRRRVPAGGAKPPGSTGRWRR